MEIREEVKSASDGGKGSSIQKFSQYSFPCQKIGGDYIVSSSDLFDIHGMRFIK